MNAPDRLADLRVNPDWAKLPLFDRSKWQRVRFGDVVENLNETVDPVEAGLERYIGLEHLEPGSLHIRTWGNVAEGTTFTRRARPGQVLFGKRRAYQRKVAVASFDAVVSGDIYVLAANRERLLSDLLPFLCLSNHFFNHAIGTSAGSLSPRTNWSSLASFEFDLPPLEQQSRITRVLSSIEDAIEKTGIARSALNKGRGDYFDHALQTAIKKEPRSLSQLGSALVAIVAGKSPKASSKPATESQFGVLKVSAVGDGVYVEDENKALLKRDDFDPDLEVKAGMILVTRANALLSGVGRACLVAKTRPGLMLSDKTLQLVPSETRIDRDFLLHGLRRNPYRAYVENAANGTGAKNISQGTLRSAPFWIPDLKRQHQVAKIMNDFTSAIESTSIQLSHLVKLRAAALNAIIR